MTTDQWQMVSERFAEAMEMPADRRPAFLEQLSSESPAVAAEVEGLLSLNSSSPTNVWSTLIGRLRQRLAGVEPFPQVPGYEIEGVLGRGGMGVVYKARQTSLNRQVALKMILTGLHADPEGLARFRTEAEAVARLQHPNIVQIYETGEHQGNQYLALEYLDGGTLAKKIDGTPQPPRDAALLVEKLARAMHFAHQAGIVHRDLKPANVLLQNQPSPVPSPQSSRERTEDWGLGTVKVTDFGLAKQLDSDMDHTVTGAVMGTPSYMASEQAAGKTKELGPLVDVYALGAILYEMLTGRPPFKGLTKLETLDQVRTQEPVSPSAFQPKTPRDLVTICLKCLQKEPAKRYATSGELADDLRRFLNGDPILTRPIGQVEKAWRWCRRNPALAITGSVAIAALVAVTVVSAASARRQANLNVQLTTERDQVKELNEQLRQQAIHLENERKRTGELYDLSLQALDPSMRLLGKLVVDMVAKSKGPSQERARALQVALGKTLIPDNVAALRTTLAELARLSPDEQRIGQEQKVLAMICQALGETKLHAGQPEEAEAFLLEALEIQKKIVNRDPKNSVAVNDLANDYYFLGAAYREKKKFDKTEAAWLKSVEMLEPIANDNRQYAGNLGRTWYNLGMLAEQAEKHDLIIERQTKAIEALRPVYKGDPATTWFVSSAYASRGWAWGEKKEYDKALADLGQAAALATLADRKAIEDEIKRIKNAKP